jgi:hypothetical protein
MISQWWSRFPLEMLIWVCGLAYLALLQPTLPATTFCVWKLAGLSACPGCGLGHSVALLLHGDLSGSVNTHPLGPCALIILLVRIFSLGKSCCLTYLRKEFHHA